MSVATQWDPDLWQPGRFTVVLGMRGSGKTWLLRSLLERVIHQANRRNDGCSWSAVDIYSGNPGENVWSSTPCIRCKDSSKLPDLAEGRLWSSFGQRAQSVQSELEQQLLARLAGSTPLCRDLIELVGAYATGAVRSLLVVDNYEWKKRHFQDLTKHPDSPWAKSELCAAAAWLSIEGVYQLPWYVFKQYVDTVFILDEQDNNQIQGIFRRMCVQEGFGLSKLAFQQLFTEHVRARDQCRVVVLDRRTRVPAVFAIPDSASRFAKGLRTRLSYFYLRTEEKKRGRD